MRAKSIQPIQLFVLLVLLVFGLGLMFQPTIQNNYFDVVAENIVRYGTARLVEYPEYFSEVVSTDRGSVIVLPPFPILGSLFGLFLGLGETYWMQLAIGLCAGIMFFIFLHHKLGMFESFFLSLGYVISSPLYFFLSQSGYWYTAQVWGVLGAQLAWFFWLKNRYTLSGLSVGVALLSRLNLGTLLVAAVLGILVVSPSRKKMLSSLIGVFGGIIVLLIWNYYRFGSVFETGYARIPGVLDEPWYQRGIMHWSYILENAKRFIWQFDLEGLGIGLFWAQPYLFMLLFCVTRKNLILVLWGVLQMFIVFMHGNWGFWQFDFRFLMDALWLLFPILFISATGWKKAVSWAFLIIAMLLHVLLLPQLRG